MTIINNWVGYGSGSGKVDEFGLPVFEADKCNNQETLAGHLNPASFMFPMGGDALFIVTEGAPEAHLGLPSANFYDTSLSAITAGWKRGLAVIAPKVGIDRLSVMVRKPVTGWVLKYTVETIDEGMVLAELTVDAGTDCGKNQVLAFDEMITEGLAAIFVEVMEVPEEPQSCCPLIVAARVRLNDYCHEDYLGMPMNCGTDCKGCPSCEDKPSAHDVKVA